MQRNFRREGKTSFGPARPNPVPSAVGWLLTVTLLACGDGSGQRVVSATDEGSDIPICDLLTDEQVSSVLPGHDGGFVAASGASLMEGVRSYQCSYSATRGDSEHMLIVILTVGSDVEQFEQWVKPGRSAKQEIHAIFRDLEVADGGMLYGATDDMRVDVWKGTSLISLELMAPGAESRSDALVTLVSSVAAKLE